MKKKRRAILIIFLVIFIAVLSGGGAFYFYQRRLPEKTVDSFLKSVQKMDFETMESLLQSSDLSALDNADVRNDAYTDFFSIINRKMTYQITANKFDMQNGTAQITAHIKYIDGTDIYKEAISEFLKHIVSTAFSGEKPTEAETQTKLASILTEKAGAAADKFSETDIVYHLIKADDRWEITFLDDETVKIMSANFKNVEEEVTRSLTDMDNEEASGTETEASETAENGTLDMTGETFSIRYTNHKLSKDFAGKPCILIYYDYTNTSSAPSSAMVDVNLQVFQNGKKCDAAIPEKNDDALDRFTTEVEPGETVTVCQAFSISGKDDVTVQAGEAFNLDSNAVSSQTLKLK